jgi:antitoxin VapB
MNAALKTRTFKSGNSEAVRLPMGLGFGIGTEVEIERRGHELVLRAVKAPTEEKTKLRRMIEALKEIGPPGEIEKRLPFEAPDRPGL